MTTTVWTDPMQSPDALHRSIVETTHLVELYGAFILDQPGGEELLDALPPVVEKSSQAQRQMGSYRDAAGTLVYVAYEKNGSILYVGITDNLFVRMSQHMRNSAWWPHMERLDWEEYPDRDAALRKEARLIRAWRPPYNSAGNPDVKHRRRFQDVK